MKGYRDEYALTKFLFIADKFADKMNFKVEDLPELIQANDEFIVDTGFDGTNIVEHSISKRDQAFKDVVF